MIDSIPLSISRGRLQCSVCSTTKKQHLFWTKSEQMISYINLRSRAEGWVFFLKGFWFHVFALFISLFSVSSCILHPERRRFLQTAALLVFPMVSKREAQSSGSSRVEPVSVSLTPYLPLRLKNFLFDKPYSCTYVSSCAL